MSLRARSLRLVILAAAVCGCQTHTDPCTPDPKIDAARAAWHGRHVVDYRYVWQQSCFCLPEAVQPIEVTVRQGRVVSATDRDGHPVSDDVRSNIETFDALYARAAAAACTADEVRFDATADGVPKSLYIDPSRQRADEEFSVTVSEFSPLR